MTSITATSTTASRAGSPFGRLRAFNLAMGALHLVQGLAMLALATSFALPVTSSFLEMSPATGKLEPDLQELFTLRLAPLVAAFLFISALAHLTLSLPRAYEWYTANLSRGVNYARWAEYSLSSSVMIVVIAMLVGIYDVASLILVFALNATMILFGWLMELLGQHTRRTNWLPFWFGSFAGVVPWLAIGIYLFGAGSGSSGGPPTFVYFIYGSLFLFFNVFAVNMLLQYKRVGRWRDYLFGERVYILLSLTAKSALAWQVFAGTLRPV
jgi:heliorhodopsin